MRIQSLVKRLRWSFFAEILHLGCLIEFRTRLWGTKGNFLILLYTFFIFLSSKFIVYFIM